MLGVYLWCFVFELDWCVVVPVGFVVYLLRVLGAYGCLYYLVFFSGVASLFVLFLILGLF